MKAETQCEPPIEIGIFPKEVSADSVYQTLKRKSVHEVLEENPTAWRHFRTLQSIKASITQPRTHVTGCLLLTGATGAGKSKIASIIAAFVGAEKSVWLDPEMQWFDGYQGQELVIVDEFRGTGNLSQLLRLMDRYPMVVPVKGGMVQWRPHQVIMTSNLTLDQMFPAADVLTLAAIKRRIIQLML